jgi:hypothetical protein
MVSSAAKLAEARAVTGDVTAVHHAAIADGKDRQELSAAVTQALDADVIAYAAMITSHATYVKASKALLSDSKIKAQVFFSPSRLYLSLIKNRCRSL